jgi:putative ABC transport system permease protein
MTIFGAIALLLSCVGVYGITAYLVSSRTHEMGIRIALGARAPNVIGLVFRRGARTALAGMAVGLCTADRFRAAPKCILGGHHGLDGAVVHGQ